MSETVRRALALVAFLPALALAQPGARSVAPALAPTNHDALISVYRRRLVDAQRTVALDQENIRALSARQTASFSVPVTRATITILTSAEAVPRAAEILRLADSIASDTPYGVPPGLNVAYRLMPRVRAPGRDTALRWGFSDPRDPARYHFSAFDDSIRVARAAREIAEVAVANAAARLPAAMRQWLPERLFSVRATDYWERAYTMMATSPALVTRTCLSRVIAACREVLRLDRPADALMSWYTPRARHAMVEPLAKPDLNTPLRRNIDAAMPGAITSCVKERDDAVCTRILRTQFDSAAYMFPARMNSVEHALVQTAVALPAAPGLKAVIDREKLSLDETIAAISGQPVERVIEQWLAQVLAAEPESVDATTSEALIATLWIVLVGALGLGGTRWRAA